MTSGPRTRYPGAQPFADDELSSQLFFGRQLASTAVADRILANRLLVLYAKSGLGKTSLLAAGVAPRLRHEGYLPLSVRVNDVAAGPTASVKRGIAVEAARQKVEFLSGSADSLWMFFKTAEFWRGDQLLTPVLILDQLEELFTLHRAEHRAAFLLELGYLVRGVCPPGTNDTYQTPPSLRVVLSLREDYLGLLEEAADDIPQILDHRFRLIPLTLDAAVDAMIQPARLSNAVFSTRPFSYDTDALRMTLGYLSKRRTTAIQTSQYVEPFQLQLICQRVERLVGDRQRTELDVPISVADLGGEEGLAATLRGFYLDTIRALPRVIRSAVQRLCEQYLISPQGRRLSLEQVEIERLFKIRPEMLERLVASRLLRSENRADSTYYELSHDALVEPVLAASRTGALVAAWVQIVLGALLFPVSAVIVLGIIVKTLTTIVSAYDQIDRQDPWLFTMFMILFVCAAWLGFSALRSGRLVCQRYQRRSVSQVPSWRIGVAQSAAGSYEPPPDRDGTPGGFTPPQDQYGTDDGAPMVLRDDGGGDRCRPIGKIRNPIMTIVFSILCSVYAIIQLWWMLNELEAFRGKDDLTPIMFFVPIHGYIEFWKLNEKVLDAKRMAGVPNAQVASPMLYLLFAVFFLPSDLNEIWQAASGGQLPARS